MVPLTEPNAVGLILAHGNSKGFVWDNLEGFYLFR